MRTFPCRWLSYSIWLDSSSFQLFWFFIVLCQSTCQVVGTNNTSTLLCSCSSSINGTYLTNINQSACTCSREEINCTKGYYLLNGTCVRCACKTKNETNSCNCSRVQQQEENVACKPGYFLLNTNHTVKCSNCSCDSETSLNNSCNNSTGQCYCKAHVLGRQCNMCALNYTNNYSSNGLLLNCFNHTDCPPGYTKRIILDPSSYQCVILTGLNASTSTPESRDTTPPNTLQLTFTTPRTINTSTDALKTSDRPTSANKPTSTNASTSAKTQESTSTPKPTNTPISTNTPRSTNIPRSTVTPASTDTPPSTNTSTSTKTPTTEEALSSTDTPTPKETAPATNPPTSINTPTSRTEYFSSTQAQTKEFNHSPTTSKNAGDQNTDEEDKNGVVMVVLVSIGVLAAVGIAIGVGCWYLRTKRKPSTPFWTVELSNARNEDYDFALLDPVTNQPHKELNEPNESDVTAENSRYCAYV